MHKLLQSENVNAAVKNTYFSHHDAVKLQILLEKMMALISTEPPKTTAKHNFKLETEYMKNDLSWLIN